MKIAKDVTELIGHTPLVRLNRVTQGAAAEVVAKLESQNPLGSVKDRIGVSMIADAERAGRIQPGKTVLIEPTSGNTGIALAFVAAVKGYKLILTMPETMSLERRVLLLALGAEIVLTPGPRGMKGAIFKAEELLASTPNAYMLQQFDNPANPKIHFETTGPEIWDDTDGRIDFLISGVGTGGTITVSANTSNRRNRRSRRWRSSQPIAQSFPEESHRRTRFRGSARVLFRAFCGGNTLMRSSLSPTTKPSTWRGGFAGRRSAGRYFFGSGGGWRLLQVARRPENAGKLIVVVLPSFGERYLSSILFESPPEPGVADSYRATSGLIAEF